ncbi:MAG: response regulator transcription factor [Flavipsychrobacter sp.]|nr:response regulator transcription factor [Flavipsychrobacter sp.]
MQPPIIRIAFAEDHVMVRKTIIDSLHAPGNMRVDIEASDGTELIDQLKKANDIPNICIMDIGMTPMDGFEATKITKRTWPDIKVLVLSVMSADMDLTRMVAYGVHGFLHKNSHPKELHKALETIYNGDIYYNELLTPQVHNDVKTGKRKLQELTEKETELLRYTVTHLSYKEIAHRTHTTEKSIEGTRDRLCTKLNIHTRQELAVFAVRYGVSG